MLSLFLITVFKNRNVNKLSQTLNLLVGIAEEGIGGIGTYAECVAAASALAGHRVTLLVATGSLAEVIRYRMRNSGIEVIDLGLKPPCKLLDFWRHVCPGAVVRYLRAATHKRLRDLNRHFDLVHLNIPPLAAITRPFATRVAVAAWFYPHGLRARISASWRVTGSATHAKILRRAIITAKAISNYRGDQQGFRDSDIVVAPTDLLVQQLGQVGISCSKCYPPVWLTSPLSKESSPISVASDKPTCTDEICIVTCCADLSHPRKNVGDILSAIELLIRQGVKISLDLIGAGCDSLLRIHPKPHERTWLKTPGLLSREQVHSRFREAHLFVTSALYEEWGYAAVEALLSGIPVVAYPVYPFPELLRGGLGVVASETSPRALADAILYAAHKRGSPFELSKIAQDRFGIAAISRQLTHIWSPQTVSR